jgi:hypothetical protein
MKGSIPDPRTTSHEPARHLTNRPLTVTVAYVPSTSELGGACVSRHVERRARENVGKYWPYSDDGEQRS